MNIQPSQPNDAGLIPDISVGDPISAPWLNSIVRSVNSQTRPATYREKRLAITCASSTGSYPGRDPIPTAYPFKFVEFVDDAGAIFPLGPADFDPAAQMVETHGDGPDGFFLDHYPLSRTDPDTASQMTTNTFRYYEEGSLLEIQFDGRYWRTTSTFSPFLLLEVPAGAEDNWDRSTARLCRAMVPSGDARFTGGVSPSGLTVLRVPPGDEVTYPAVNYSGITRFQETTVMFAGMTASGIAIITGVPLVPVDVITDLRYIAGTGIEAYLRRTWLPPEDAPYSPGWTLKIPVENCPTP